MHGVHHFEISLSVVELERIASVVGKRLLENLLNLLLIHVGFKFNSFPSLFAID